MGRVGTMTKSWLRDNNPRDLPGDERDVTGLLVRGNISTKATRHQGRWVALS
jgi:hypothetical protein